ncbi:MAG: TniB family NTP-binding protein [Candidatus Cloacimonetes bacterium]|nr:TniB family NTP-binding protein [Candidatus Cloacimonadota bacterium]
MKEYALAKTQNVQKANELLEYLQKRPKTEMVGLGLIYGEPGLGKSRFARQAAIQNDYIYFRLEATMTAKSFTGRLLERIYYHFGMPKIGVRGTANEIFHRSLEILKNFENTIIVIDEIDYAFKNKKILGSIRDIVDETLSIVVLVGMADAKEKLLSADVHYFDRCNFFCEFKSLQTDDLILLCDAVCDINVDKTVIRHIAKKTKGNIRKFIKSLYSLESLAEKQNIQMIKPEHIAIMQ